MKVYFQDFVHSVHIFKYTLCIVRIYTMCIVCYHIRVRKIESAKSRVKERGKKIWIFLLRSITQKL